MHWQTALANRTGKPHWQTALAKRTGGTPVEADRTGDVILSNPLWRVCGTYGGTPTWWRRDVGHHRGGGEGDAQASLSQPKSALSQPKSA